MRDREHWKGVAWTAVAAAACLALVLTALWFTFFRYDECRRNGLSPTYCATR